MATGGHLFVVHGCRESLQHDAAVVPAGRSGIPHARWSSLTGGSTEPPKEWEAKRWGVLDGAADRVSVVGVGGKFADPYEVILDRCAAAIRNVRNQVGATRPTRGAGTFPLVVVPVIGIGRGGYSEHRGTIVRQLITRLHTLASTERVDIAVVAPEAPVYAAAQYARQELPSPLSEELERSARNLGDQAAHGHLALLMGAGVSIPAGLPSWAALISRLAQEYDVPGVAGDDRLTLIDQAELIERADNERGRFGERVAAIVREAERPSLLHGLLASLDCREVVTTNYDVLYEVAVSATGRDITSVMPWASAHGADRWVLKLHGDVAHPDKIVLTRRHMVRYDAANRPSAALLQSLLLTKTLLVVGASMTDDNVIRLAHEVQDYRSVHQPDVDDTFGTVLDVSNDQLRAQLWEKQLDWVSLFDPKVKNGYRLQELFLDRVAFHASRDSSWLLDERFEGLLPKDRDRDLARAARQLLADLPSEPDGPWQPLRKRLQGMAAKSPSAASSGRRSRS